MNVGALLSRHARYRANHLAVVCGAHRLTFRQLADRVNRLANALAAIGLRKGDKLAIVLPNGIELLEAYRAAAQLGLVSVPLSPLLRGEGLVSLLREDTMSRRDPCWGALHEEQRRNASTALERLRQMGYCDSCALDAATALVRARYAELVT